MPKISARRLMPYFFIATGLLFASQNLAAAEEYSVNLTVTCEDTEPSISPTFNAEASSENVSASGTTLTVNVAVGDSATIAIDPDAQEGTDCEDTPIPAEVTITYGGDLAASPFVTDSCAGFCSSSETPISIYFDPMNSTDGGDYTGTITLAIVTSP